MKTHLLTLSVLSALRVWAAVNVPLTVQEAIYPGSVAGVTRTSDPVTVGVPLPDDASTGVADVNQLTLTGASVGQFRVLGRWPSGRIKWVLVDTQASLAAGQTNTSISLTSGGTGNFGGANLATDNGATITVVTGAGTFTIRKANFNGIDAAVVGGRTIVAAGTSKGLVITGPAPGQTTCPPCTTIYASSNDGASTAVIEENGPGKTVIKATGSHKDSSGAAYMNFTVRMYFYKDKSYVKVTSILRNADYGASNTFATAYKGHQGYEFRVAANIAGTANYSLATHTATPSNGTITSADSVYLYQAESQNLKQSNWCGYLCVPFTAETGYRVVKNGVNTVTGTDTQYPQGWADVQDATGAGVQIGTYQMAAYGLKSLEFNNGGSDVRVGMWARQNSQPYYQPWPQWSINDVYLNFHATALASPAAEFLKAQHFLVARANYTHYNNAKVFPYALVDPATEDGFYKSTASTANPATISQNYACCVQDFGTVDTYAWPLQIYRFYPWGNGGGGNQAEFRWSSLLNFITRGFTGRYLNSAHFFRMQAEKTWPHSDGFNWRDRPQFNQPNAELTGFGFPTATSLNSDKSFRNWIDQEHAHWYGMTDYYFMAGDETIREAMMDGPKDYYLTVNSYQNGKFGALWNSRSAGIQMIGAARFSEFLAAVGDPDAAQVLSQGVETFNVQVKSDLCVSGYPSGCNAGPVDGGPWTSQGVSRTRGIRWGSAGDGSSQWCGVAHNYRIAASFQTSILIQGVLELRNAKGAAWADYYNSLDLAYGMSRWALSESFVDDGSGRWDTNGFRYYVALDAPSACPAGSSNVEAYAQAQAQQTVSMAFLPKYLVEGTTDWATKFKINLQKDMVVLGTNTADFGTYQPAHLISVLNNPGSSVLTDVAVTSAVDNGGGSYTISWTVPANTQSYRIKWGPKRIVDWVGFDPLLNTFTGDPATTMPWFAGNNIASLPVPAAAGSVQTLAISAGVAGLKASNFSVKAYISGGISNPIPNPNPTPTPTVISMVSGNGQSGTTGQALPAPFAVKVTDANGNAAAGVSVMFTVLQGGGSVTAGSTVTNSSGVASTTLVLGPTAGVNNVSATSGTLAGGSVTFTATAVSPSSGGTGGAVSWTKQPETAGWPGYAAWTSMYYDPISTQMLLYAVVKGSSSIYATDMFFYNPEANLWTRLPGGNGALQNSCSASTASWPGDRHPMTQMAVDTKRKVMWLSGGVCGGETRKDMYFLKLNPNPLDDTWTRVNPAHYPYESRFSSMVYDPDNDVLFSYGYDGGPSTHNNWIYCRTAENPTPGTVTAKQAAAGCAAPDDWTEVQVVGGIRPTSTSYAMMVYDPVTKKVILYAGNKDGWIPAMNETWAYDVAARKWTQKALSTTPPPVDTVSYIAQPALAYNTATQKIIYHQTAGAGAPADWQYDTVADKWEKLASGTGATVAQIIAYDSSRNLLVGYNMLNYAAEVWHAKLSGSAPILVANPCDLNGDSTVNVLDVQLAVVQGNGTTACGTGDLNKDGRCDAADKDIVVNASLGAGCQAP